MDLAAVEHRRAQCRRAVLRQLRSECADSLYRAKASGEAAGVGSLVRICLLGLSSVIRTPPAAF